MARDSRESQLIELKDTVRQLNETIRSLNETIAAANRREEEHLQREQVLGVVDEVVGIEANVGTVWVVDLVFVTAGGGKVFRNVIQRRVQTF